MIQNITNLFNVNKTNKPQAPMSRPIVYNRASAPDVFVKNTQNAPAFKGLPYSHDRSEKLASIAYDAEEEDQNFKDAEKILTKRFLEIEKHIKTLKKDTDGKPVPIKNNQLISDYHDATIDLVSNFGLQQKTIYDEYDNDDEADAKDAELQQRSANYIQRAINVGDKHFAPDVFKDHKVDLEGFQQVIADGDTIDRMLEIDGKAISVYDRIMSDYDTGDGSGLDSGVEPEHPESDELAEKSFEQIMGDDEDGSEVDDLGEKSFEQIMGDDEEQSGTAQLGKRSEQFDDAEYPTHPSTPEEVKAENKKVLEMRESSRQQLKNFIPEEVDNDYYNFDDSKAIDSFSSLSILAANNAVNEHKVASGAPKLKKAYKMLDVSQQFLQQKDPQQIYWDSNDFNITRKKISESAGTNTMDKETPDDFESLMGVQNEDLTLQKRLGHLEKLAAAPTLLGMVVAFDMHDTISKSAIDLLSRHKSEEAKEQLAKIAKDKDIKDHIKAFATTHLPKK